jgi:hypothetical protein
MQIIVVLSIDKALALTEQQEWILSGTFGRIPLSAPEAIIGLLPLLEMDYDSFLDKLQQHYIPEPVINTFPLHPLLQYPFDNQRKFWAEDAMRWLLAINDPQALSAWAQTITTDWMPQKLKHQFRVFFRLGK